jgi:3-deoxy-manno-octulosonate cytidylyltransferase (CMP-KDO synthetase)
MAPKVSCVIPARLAASRFPGKLLQPLQGKPVILHTLDCAAAAGCFEEVLCITDSEIILALVRKAGFRAELSGPAANGTERIAKNLRTISHDLIVNLQGDEPVFPREGLLEMSQSLIADPTCVHVLVHDRELSDLELANPNRCKVALDDQNQVLDFYRAKPHDFSSPRPSIAYTRLQMGIYGYAKSYLRKYGIQPVSPLELSESHELLRDLGLAKVMAHACSRNSQAVDVPQDLEEARAILLRTA